MDEPAGTPSSIFDRWPPATLVSLGLALLFFNLLVQGVVQSWFGDAVVSMSVAAVLVFWLVPFYLVGRAAPEDRLPAPFFLEEMAVHPLRGQEAGLLTVIALGLILPLDLLGELNRSWIEIPPEQLEFQRELLPTAWLDGMLTLLALAVIVPIGEEVVFRGIVQQACRTGLGPMPAVLLSGALFGLLHLQPWYSLPLVATGIVLGLVYEITGTLWASVLLHVLYNGLVLLLWMFWTDSSALVAGVWAIPAALLSAGITALALRALVHARPAAPEV